MLEAKANTGPGLDKLATDLVAGEHIPLNKLVTGGLGVNGGPVTLDNPLPTSAQIVDNTGASLIGGTGGLKTEGLTEITQINYLGQSISSTNRLPVEDSRGGTAVTPVFSTIVDNTGTIIAASGALTVNGATSLLLNGNPASPTNAVPSQLVTAGAVVSSTNPVPTRTIVGSAVASITNPNPTVLSKIEPGSGLMEPVSGINPLPIDFIVPASGLQTYISAGDGTPDPLLPATALWTQLASGGAAVSSTNPLPTVGPTLGVLSTTAQSVINISVLNGGLNAAGWVDVAGITELSVNVFGSVGITAGQIVFEGTNNNTQVNGIALLYDEPLVLTSRNLITPVAIAANTSRLFRVPVVTRFVRVRISTAFVGGTINTFTHRTTTSYAPSTLGVNATIQGTPAVSISAVNQTIAGLTLETSASRLVSGVGVTLTQGNARGISVAHNISVLTGGTTPTVQLRLQVLDPVTSTWGDVPGGLLPSRNAIGLFITTIYPGLTAATGILDTPIPRVFRFAWTITGAPTGCTFSIGGNYLI
jgi:hypothetical protein